MSEIRWSKVHWSSTKRARFEAAHRPRRVIFNDDTHELALEDANTLEGFLTSDRAARRNTGRHHLLVGVVRAV